MLSDFLVSDTNTNKFHAFIYKNYFVNVLESSMFRFEYSLKSIANVLISVIFSKQDSNYKSVNLFYFFGCAKLQALGRYEKSWSPSPIPDYYRGKLLPVCTNRKF